MENAEAQILALQEKITSLKHELSKTELLLERIQTHSANVVAHSKEHKRKEAPRVFQASKQNTRFIALKFAYLGQAYNGFEYHANNITPRPTVEEVLWQALNKAKIIMPNPLPIGAKITWDGCEYSKCGRTDRGVNAFGQVISLRVRSNRPLPHAVPPGITTDVNEQSEEIDASLKSNFDNVTDEIPYVAVLNRLLPADIRVLAWCPDTPNDFSARFSCKERRYKYFFTQPAFLPPPLHSSLSAKANSGWLDIEAMNRAASLFKGLHDFRNFCKVDASQQITNFTRRIFHSEVRPISAEELETVNHDGSSREGNHIGPKHGQAGVYVYVLHGSAFLWHQVRHMVAILFLVGQGLEQPEIVLELLNIEKNPRRPAYQMAEEMPLVLWDCVFDDDLHWIYAGDEQKQTSWLDSNQTRRDSKYGTSGSLQTLWSLYRRSQLETILASSLFSLATSKGVVRSSTSSHPAAEAQDIISPGSNGKAHESVSTETRIYAGGVSYRNQGKYQPVLTLPKLDTVDNQNAHYVARKAAAVPAVEGPKV